MCHIFACITPPFDNKMSLSNRGALCMGSRIVLIFFSENPLKIRVLYNGVLHTLKYGSLCTTLHQAHSAKPVWSSLDNLSTLHTYDVSSPEPAVAAVGQLEGRRVWPDVEAITTASYRPLAPGVAAAYRKDKLFNSYRTFQLTAETELRVANILL